MICLSIIWFHRSSRVLLEVHHAPCAPCPLPWLTYKCQPGATIFVEARTNPPEQDPWLLPLGWHMYYKGIINCFINSQCPLFLLILFFTSGGHYKSTNKNNGQINRYSMAIPTRTINHIAVNMPIIDSTLTPPPEQLQSVPLDPVNREN